MKKNLDKKNQSLFKKFIAYYKPHKKTFALDMLCSSLEATDLVFDLIYKETGLIYSVADLGFIMM